MVPLLLGGWSKDTECKKLHQSPSTEERKFHSDVQRWGKATKTLPLIFDAGSWIFSASRAASQDKSVSDKLMERET